ncbi:MAG: RdgB/HAM1 family non-canonical purine NTP pyrophosphatase [Proteobacteria bacterium]|nr:RdgB/HAM1 family non-canonical purine NTP pyrophosphatase [Pseudomonadota bacterium]
MKIVLATNNEGKVKEILAFLDGLNIELISQAQFNVPPIAETGLSFVENALMKARHAAQYSQLPALADDSGLVVDALQGAPGIFSARFAGPTATSVDNIHKLLSQMQNIEKSQRTAHFYCALVFVRHAKDPAPIICQAKWDGEILSEQQGNQGFGYDPIFYVPTHHCSAAELTLAQKNTLSHRAKALAQFKEQFQHEYIR